MRGENHDFLNAIFVDNSKAQHCAYNDVMEVECSMGALEKAQGLEFIGLEGNIHCTPPKCTTGKRGRPKKTQSATATIANKVGGLEFTVENEAKATWKMAKALGIS